MRIAIIGSGPGGYVAAIKAAQLGAQVTVIEKDEVGGTCLNWGCIPTKTLSASAEALYKAKRLSEYGIDVQGEVKPDLSRIIDRKDKVVATQIKGIRSLFKFRNINLIEGSGRIKSIGQIDVEKRDGTRQVVEADKIIIASGSRPARISTFPIDGKSILSSNEAVVLRQLPQSLIIIGAGVIGCEFACIFAEFGVEITMLELLDRAVSTEDYEISEILERELKKKKIKVVTGVKVERVEILPDGVRAVVEGEKTYSAEKMLVSIGRQYNTEDIGLEAVGISKGPRGEIIVDDSMETTIKGIYAVGDVVGGMLLAHVASKEGIVAAVNACGGDMKMDYSVVPAAIFTSPEIGSVGLREHQAVSKGLKVRAGRFQFRALGKAHAMGEIAGFVKIIADSDSDRILGVHIIGPHAADLVHEGALAIKGGMTAKQLGEMIHAHPTLSEGLMEAAEDVHGSAIHSAK
ncbi:MAG TPA: dihydrolipoyl dehydrogenase [Dissulfurispiraceae bacterium]|nr:dihydrolipoyl dehydrogenase [Dissulfurispiraceae bacterium]